MIKKDYFLKGREMPFVIVNFMERNKITAL